MMTKKQKFVPIDFRAVNTTDIQERLTKIPVELHPAINRVACKIAGNLGWASPENFDFKKKSKNPRVVQIYYLALVSFDELQEFCLDYWGTGLDELIPQDEKAPEEVA